MAMGATSIAQVPSSNGRQADSANKASSAAL